MSNDKYFCNISFLAHPILFNTKKNCLLASACIAYPKGLKCMDNHWFLFFTLYFPPILSMHWEEPLLSALHTFLCACTHLKLVVTQFLFLCVRWCYLAPQNCVWILPLQVDVILILFLETYLGLDNKTWGECSWQGKVNPLCPNNSNAAAPL